MPRLVEDAGGELAAGHFFKSVRYAGTRGCTRDLAGRTVTLTVTPVGVAVSHARPDPGADAANYLLPAVFTRLPSGGLRPWWACPGCGARVDSLFLPAGREELGCRRCCRLTYRSQQTPRAVEARRPRPSLWVERSSQRWKSGPGGDLVLVAANATRRRL